MGSFDQRPDDLRSALNSTPSPRVDGSSAAVSVVFRRGGAGTELLFIQRASTDTDPWSGHMAFPGGRTEDADLDRICAAITAAVAVVPVETRTFGAVATTVIAVAAEGRTRRAVTVRGTLSALGAVSVGCGAITVGGTRRSLTVGRALAARSTVTRRSALVTVTVRRSVTTWSAVAERRTLIAVTIGRTCGTVTV